MENKTNFEKMCIYKKRFPFVSFVLFGVVYMAYYFVVKNALFESTLLVDERVLKPIKLYGPYAGFVLGLIGMIVIYVLILLKKILFLGKIKIINLLILLTVYGGFGYLGYFLVYREPKTTQIAVGIIDFVGNPLFYTSIIVIFVILLLHISQSIFYYVKGKKGNIEKAQ